MRLMRRFRLLLFFVLYAVAEMAVPHAVNALEAVEGTEEGVRHGRRVRPALRAAREQAPGIERAALVAAAPRRVPGVPRARVAAAPAIRKIPPLLAESPSAPEDH
jgi:hypothetical protein